MLVVMVVVVMIGIVVVAVVLVLVVILTIHSSRNKILAVIASGCYPAD